MTGRIPTFANSLSRRVSFSFHSDDDWESGEETMQRKPPLDWRRGIKLESSSRCVSFVRPIPQLPSKRIIWRPRFHQVSMGPVFAGRARYIIWPVIHSHVRSTLTSITLADKSLICCTGNQNMREAGEQKKNKLGIKTHQCNGTFSSRIKSPFFKKKHVAPIHNTRLSYSYRSKVSLWTRVQQSTFDEKKTHTWI